MPATNTTVETVPHDSNPDTDQPRALAVQIGDRPLWLGNAGAGDPDHLVKFDIEPDAIVSLTRHRTAATTDHHPISDAIINDSTMFRAAVETTLGYYRAGVTTLVHCAAGISRSATVLATALAVEEDCAFETAVDTVQQHRQRANPHLKLRINAYDYLIQQQHKRVNSSSLAEYRQSVVVTRADSGAVADRILNKRGDSNGGS